METSIIKTIKEMLGIHPDDTHFDTEIIVNINSAIMALSQIGVGPDDGFSIAGDTAEWQELIGNNLNLEAVKTFIYIKTKLLFDPPVNSFVVNSLNNMLREVEWRLNSEAERRCE